ncbi:OLC1v1007689C1 [Oldenlandia corymbosa var. corymbosa]|uniref:(+)-abscisic acid 8'-hydroxylase n=1 Tax=Oldenlandia corymbosa var. corymbosa TaxID=529605 RepID=A0AAV1DJX6_OLDCO|nr:OLC1v1007689C1 [Oldenlandia corymbosa var. corymbosa]
MQEEEVLCVSKYKYYYYSCSSSPSMMMMMMMLLMVVVVGWLMLRQWWWSWRRLRLPPGSMGWPYIGETLKLYTQNPNSFFSTRQKRYGEVFKTHILGCPCVMISSPEAARIVLVTQSQLFKPTYPPSKERIIGPEALFFHGGDYHSVLKKLVRDSFLPVALKPSVPALESIVLSLLSPWGSSDSDSSVVINALQEMKKFAFEVAIHSALGGEKAAAEIQGIKHLYHQLEKGYNSMPLDFPGTAFHTAMKARKKLTETLKRLIKKRRESINDSTDEGGGGGGALLEMLLQRGKTNYQNNNNKKKYYELSETQIVDNIIGVIFAAHDTTASVLTWVLKYLHDHPSILGAVLREQEEIRELRIDEGNRGLMWEDTKRMPFTTRVIQETLRSASILSFTFREAVEDVEFQGYVIPKGWKVLPLFRSIHHSPQFYPQPHKFDPSRFEVQPKANTYMPFGNGVHSCPGNELAKLEMLIFLHHFTTNFRWEVVGGEEDGIQYGPFPVPKGGFPISLTRRSSKME